MKDSNNSPIISDQKSEEHSSQEARKKTDRIFSHIIKIIAVIIPLATATAVIFNQVAVRRSISESKETVISAVVQMDKPTACAKNEIVNAINEVVNNDLSASTDLLVGLFGIVISVWVGLNIYNAMKKDDYCELLDTITEKCKEHDNIQAEAEENLSINMEFFSSYLYKAFDASNNSSQYFQSIFSQDTDLAKRNYKFILDATYLETIYTQITSLHEKNEHANMLPYIEAAHKRCKKMLDWLKTNKDNVPNENILQGYIAYRRGRICFYNGMREHYVNNDNKKASQLFMEAAEHFKAAINYDKDIPKNIDIYNTLGYIYIKIHMWNEDRLTPLYNASKLDNFIKTALTYCQKSEQKTVNSIKNLGIAYERTGSLTTAMVKYQKACEIDPYDYESHLCLASAYLKLAQNLLGIEKDRNQLLCEMEFSNTQNVYEYIESAQLELNVAGRINPKSPSLYCKLGQLYTYRMLLETDEQQKKELEAQAKQNFKISNNFIRQSSMNPNVTHRFHERNFYEAIGDIERALNINDQLDGRDTLHLKPMYIKALHKK